MNISILPNEDCCGCNACYDVCPKKCISFINDNEGFWYPNIDPSKCIDCGLCVKNCPVINQKDVKYNDLDVPSCYAARHKNLNVVFDSTSGGLFSACAEVVYAENGFVGGAIFNNDFSVRHFISNNKDDLSNIRSSKYLQSNACGFYNKLKNILKSNTRMVLVCGTPCQIAAVKKYIGTDYPNLILLDFICLGVNSPKIWQKYLKSFEDRYGSPVVYSKSKSKEYGWRNLTQKVKLKDGSVYYEPRDRNNFMKGFLETRIFSRPSCYSCKFKGLPRISDITLADFWGIEKVTSFDDFDIGTSLVMVNSRKGANFFEKVHRLLDFSKVSIDSVLQGNRAIMSSIPKPVINRSAFFSDLDTMSFDKIADKYFIGVQQFILKEYVKKIFKLIYSFIRLIRQNNLGVLQYFKLLKYNKLKFIIRKKIFFITPYCCVNIHKSAKMDIHGLFILGDKMKFPKSKLETRFLLDKSSQLSVFGDFSIGVGSNIEIFNNAKLIIRGSCFSSSYMNVNCTIICGKYIEIGHDVMIGRNVTIRDTNGGHFLNRETYRDSESVIIGDKVWIASGVTIMPGVNIGKGAVIGANSLVLHDIPPYSLAVGSPAKVIDSEVLWKT